MLRATSFGMVVAALSGPSSATLLVYDPFSHGPVGSEISEADGSGGWLKVPATTTEEPKIAEGNLSYGGLPWTPTGNSVTISGAGAGVLASSTLSIPGQPFVSADAPTLYYSMLLKVNDMTGAATGGGSFIAGFRNNGTTSGLAGAEAGAPLLIRQTTAGSGTYQLGTGITQETGDRMWDTVSRTTAETLLVVVAYEFVSGGDDFARLWVNPDPSLSEAQNSDALRVNATVTTPTRTGIREGRITNFFLRNNGSAPEETQIDELRIADSWADVFTTVIGGIWLGGSGNWSESAKWSGAAIPDAASLPVQIDAGNAIASAVTLDQDATVRSVSLNAGDTLTIPVGRVLNLAGAGSEFSGGVDNAGTINAPGLTVSGAGGQLVNHGALIISGLRLNDGGTLVMSPGDQLLKLDLAVPGTSGPLVIDTADGSKLDLGGGKVIVSGVAAGTWNGSAYSGIAGLVDSGRGSAGNALWDGPGIVTSDTRAIDNGDLVSIGVAQVSEVRNVADTETTTFAGQTVLGSDVIAMVTWGGDATLDGKINIDDYGRIDGNVGQSGSVFGWSRGDFNYDGKINIDDYGIIDGNINRQGDPFSTASAEGVSAVPEPALVGLATLGLLGWRRRRPAPTRPRTRQVC